LICFFIFFLGHSRNHNFIIFRPSSPCICTSRRFCSSFIFCSLVYSFSQSCPKM